MSKQVYNWKRFWCPRSGRINPMDGGYLLDPDEVFGKIYNRDLVTLEALSHLRCLVLLGEPGIGKTQVIKAEEEKSVSKQGEQEIFLNLRSYGSEDRLVDNLFKKREFRDWYEGTHILHIFLDSLDECLLRIDTVATLLVDEFKYYKNEVNRLYLRIACRTAVWPTVLEEGLKEIWGKNSVGIYELAPLRRVDVIEAAKIKGLSSDEFLDEIERKNIVPLAIKPVTLKFLLNIYCHHDSQFSLNQKRDELYLKGCRCLCEEVNKNRRHSNSTRGKLDADQRLIVAARIAALTILANRFAVWTDVDLGNVPDEDIPLQELCIGYEKANEREFEITREAIEEVLDTGLFSSRGLHQMGWAHQTYAEFLSAWYLKQHKIPLVQIRKLIFSSEESGHKLIPQLYETATWLASMREDDVLQEIIKTDPDVLLRNDIPTAAIIRTSIVDNLLIQYEKEQLFERGVINYSQYANLKHSELAHQLRPYICDSNKHIEARELAIKIAEACELFEFQECLVNLALDSSQSIHLRVSAVHALCSIGDSSTKLKLKPLAINQLPEDENDQLKGYTLSALWPDLLSAQELFQALTAPKRRNLFGGYQNFIINKIPLLKPNDLVIALDWLEKQGVRGWGHPFDELGNKILLKAWEYFDSPGVVEGFAKVALVHWKEYIDIQTEFDKLLLNDEKNRHALIEKAVLIVSDLDSSKQVLFFAFLLLINSRLHRLASLLLQKYSDFYVTKIDRHTYNILAKIAGSVLISEDTFWLLEKIKNCNCENTQLIWSQLLESRFNRQNVQEIDAILTATQNNQILKEVFASYFEPIELDSSIAKKIKENHIKIQKMQNQKKNLPLLNPPPKERVLQLLEKLEAGDLAAWWQLNMEMTLTPYSKYYNNELELDLTKLPGWKEAEKTTRKRIIEGAKKYILQQIITNIFDIPALAGCKALLLLLQENQDFLNTLLPEIWQKWTPVIIAAPDYENKDLYLEIVKLAYQKAPEEAINTLITLIDKENLEGDDIFIIRRFYKCWDERLKLAVLKKAKDPTLKPKCIRQLFEELLKQGLTEARDFAKSLISFPLPFTDNERQKSLIAATILVQYSEPSSWSFIWSLIEQDSSFGREVFELAAWRGIRLNINETQLADLYIWLVREYPHDEDPDYSNDVMAHAITCRENMAKLRDDVLSQLKEYGTFQACNEIQRLIRKLPQLPWLRKTLIVAQANRRQKQWNPPRPEDILQVILNQDKRLVQNGYELLEVLIEALNRLELELQGETPAVRSLWDKRDKKIFIPIDENDFSDYVKCFLDRDLKSRGIIVNREVELRRGSGGNPGERTDIHVDAVLKHKKSEVYDSITAIIEVKGCWHDELETAMESQLVERYLADNVCSYGLYLVGWFSCQQWDDNDSRKKKTPKMNIDQAKKQFDDQAKQLSSSGKIVRAYILNTALR